MVLLGMWLNTFEPLSIPRAIRRALVRVDHFWGAAVSFNR
jgi:hypothetical protein